MDFESARKQFERLFRLFKNGQIDQEEFIKGVDDLAIKDDQGVEWQIGMQSGHWYRKQGKDWIEDDPLGVDSISFSEETGARKRKVPRKGIILGLMLLVILAILLGPRWLASESAGPSGNEPNGLGLNLFSTETILNQRDPSLPEVHETEQDESFSETPTLTQAGVPSGAADPTTSIAAITPTMPPPPAAYSPQVWAQRFRLTLEKGLLLTKDNDWYILQELPWEYEFLSLGGRNALLLQFDQDVALWPDGQQISIDSERTITLAIPRDEGSVSLVCRWDPDQRSGYELRLTRQAWELELFVNGIKTVLAEGRQSEAFRLGEFETFRLVCLGNEVSVWAGNHHIADVIDERYSQGADGLLFMVESGIGVVYIAEDLVLVQNAGEVKAGTGTLMRLGPLEVQLLGQFKEYQQLPASPYDGQPVTGLALRVVNHGEVPIHLGINNIYLQKDEQKILALSLANDSADALEDEDIPPLHLPIDLANKEVTGEVFFLGVGLSQISEWQLVVDLRYEGYGEIRFDLSE